MICTASSAESAVLQWVHCRLGLRKLVALHCEDDDDKGKDFVNDHDDDVALDVGDDEKESA